MYFTKIIIVIINIWFFLRSILKKGVTNKRSSLLHHILMKLLHQAEPEVQQGKRVSCFCSPDWWRYARQHLPPRSPFLLVMLNTVHTKPHAQKARAFGEFGMLSQQIVNYFQVNTNKPLAGYKFFTGTNWSPLCRTHFRSHLLLWITSC